MERDATANDVWFSLSGSKFTRMLWPHLDEFALHPGHNMSGPARVGKHKRQEVVNNPRLIAAERSSAAFQEAVQCSRVRGSHARSCRNSGRWMGATAHQSRNVSNQTACSFDAIARNERPEYTGSINNSRMIYRCAAHVETQRARLSAGIGCCSRHGYTVWGEPDGARQAPDTEERCIGGGGSISARG